MNESVNECMTNMTAIFVTFIHSFNSTFIQRPHNDPIWILCENGLFGFLTFYTFYGYIIYNLIKSYFHNMYTNTRVDIILMLFVLIGYLVLSLFTFPKERIFHQVLLSLFLAYSSYLTIGQGKFNQTLKVPRKTFGILIIIFTLVVSSVFGSYRVRGEYFTKMALYHRGNQNWNQVITEINKAYTPFYTLDQTAIPLKFYSGIASYSLGNYSIAIDDLKIAKENSPYNVHVLNNLGSSYFNSGQYPQAIKSYRELLTYYPWFSEAIANLTVAYINSGQIEEAVKLLDNESFNIERKNEIISYLKSINIEI